MAKKKYTAVHNLLLDQKTGKYAAPGTSFLMEEKDGDKLVGLGAAIRAEEEKKASTKKAAPRKPDADAGDGDGDGDLV